MDDAAKGENIYTDVCINKNLPSHEFVEFQSLMEVAYGYGNKPFERIIRLAD
jgi:hypothetical protein